VVVFIALHDWIALGPLNHLEAVRRSDPTSKLIMVTFLSTLPFAIGLAASLVYVPKGWPEWLMWWLWVSYGLAAYGALRAWWIPYLLVEEPARAARYQIRFAGTHSFLPTHNGIRPDTLHCVLHGAILAILLLLVIASHHGHF